MRMMWAVVAIALAILAAPIHGQASSVLTPSEGEVLQLTGFGVDLTPSLLPPLWDAEGLYVANHSSRVRQWWHSTRPHLLLTYEPITAGPTAPRRWIVLEVDPNGNRLTRNPPVAELSRAGPRPWERRGGGWRARGCMGVLMDTPAELSTVTELRQRDSCGTLTWRLVGLGEQNPGLASIAGRFRASDEYNSGAPVYRADSGAVLQRIVSDLRSSWVLQIQTPDDDIQLAALGEFTDRINLIRTERFVAASLPGQDFRDKPVFVCEPNGWERGDSDFTLPDLDGYTTDDDLGGRARWGRQQFTEEDQASYELAFGHRPERHARIMVVENVTRMSLNGMRVSLKSPPIQLIDTGCAMFRVHNDGFRLTVTRHWDDGRTQDLMKTASLGGWRDLVVSLPGSGRVTLAASHPNNLSNRLAVSQVIMFNETCTQLQGRASPCEIVTCENGGTCASVTTKHPLCLCPPGFIGARCETQVNCGQPPDIAFGEVAHLSGTTYLDRAYYKCLSGRAPTKTVLGLAWSSCHYDGSWVNIPRCELLADAHRPQPYIECDFNEDCPGFNTRVDNFYNTDTDREWQRTERLRTSDIRPQGAFLTVYRVSSHREVTARVLTPCLDLPEPGCLRLDIHLVNATSRVQEFPSNRVLFRTTEGGRRTLIPLEPRVGPLLLRVRLMHGESEAALDAIRVYRRTCEELLQLSHDDEEVTWPTWSPSGPMGQNETERNVENNAPASSHHATAPILLLLVPLMMLLGLLMILGCSRE